ncbi:NnrU family protein [Curvivirga sp.]|uniref:NnrU family protein n=1 Tax=Curvivirga sp. TaxID=2856848 RepID=UPI003B5AE3F8
MDVSDNLAFATALFVLSHFLLSSTAIRTPVISKIGDKGFRITYSIISFLTFAWMLVSYGNAFYQPIWEPPMFMRFGTLILMLPACILLFCSLTTKSPTMVGGEESLNDSNPNGNVPKGIITITRHPMLMATSLWAIGHLLSNGDRSTMIIAIGILILSIGGMLHIDQRRSDHPAWGVIALTTSIFPFHAAIQKRVKIDWKGIGLWRLLGGLILFAGLIYGHETIAGIALMPS